MRRGRADADVIVVGAGASGSALAARLTQDGKRHVLLIEAGPTPRTPTDFPAELRDAGTVAGAHWEHRNNWSYPAMLTSSREYMVARGRILGGSTTINGGYFIRPRREDIAAWAAEGGKSWDWDHILPLMRQLETDDDYPDSPVHGHDGPIPVRRPKADDAISRAFASAAARAGFPNEADKNDQSTPGIGPVPMNVRNGLRWNAGLAYIVPALNRPNLEMIGDARATRVLIEDGRAVGVEVATVGGIREVRARETVLAAGTFGTAHLLLLSGVGPASQLAAAGIPLARDIPGIGQAFSDHPQIAVQWRARPGIVDVGLDRIMGNVLAATSGVSGQVGDLELLPMLKPTPALLGIKNPEDDLLDVYVAAQAPRARGTLTVLSADPAVPPAIHYRYLETAEDRVTLRAGVRLAARLLNDQAFADIRLGLEELEPQILQHDDALDGWIANRIGTSNHAVGTASFAPSAGADRVVSPEGSVIGIPGLRIADLSILPTVPLRGPAATAVLIGEVVAAAMIR